MVGERERLSSGVKPMFQTIPLGKLVASPRNVRRHGDPAADAELKASIAAHRPAAKPRGAGRAQGPVRSRSRRTPPPRDARTGR